MRREPDPLTNDLWITWLMAGAAHHYPAGKPKALCGVGWSGSAWDSTIERPKDVCLQCSLLLSEAELTQEPRSVTLEDLQNRLRDVEATLEEQNKTLTAIAEWIEKVQAQIDRDQHQRRD